MSYAKVLGATSRQDGYLEGNGYLVSWCVGHLVELAPPNVYDEKYTKWSIADLPILPQKWQYLVSASTKKQFGILQKLMHRPDVDSIVNSCDVEHIAQTAHVKVIIIQMFHPCRKTAPIRVIHLNHAAIWNAIEVIIVAVDETNILRQRFRLPDAPPANARLRDVFEDLYAFLLDDLAVIVRKFKQIPVPGGRNGVPAIGRQVLFRDLPAFQRLTSYLVVGGKADSCTVFPEVEIAFIVDKVDRFFYLLHQHPPSNSSENLLRPSASQDSSTVAL